MQNTVLHPELLERIRSYLDAKGISKAEFGRLCMNDPSFVYDLEAGRELRLRTQQRVRDFVATRTESAA